jgi:hypothetical protein
MSWSVMRARAAGRSVYSTAGAFKQQEFNMLASTIETGRGDPWNKGKLVGQKSPLRLSPTGSFSSASVSLAVHAERTAPVHHHIQQST